MKVIAWLIVSVVLLAGSLISLPASIDFKQNCSYYMKRAADANTIEVAIPEMEKVVSYIEDRGLTKGYTHLLVKTPAGDLSFWYKNMKAALADLKSVDPNASQLEKSNVLMKLRETLLDHGKDSEDITVPDHTAFYPHQRAIIFTSWICAIMLAVLIVIGAIFITE